MANKLSYGKGAKILVHAGAGAVSRAKMTKARETQCLAKLEQALVAGSKVIDKGGTAIDAVIAAVKVLEDSPLFNAGKGSCLNRQGKVEMDSAIMSGENLETGAVTGVTCVKNPVLAARAVMEFSPHVLLMGAGANKFSRSVAKKAGLAIVSPEYFVTERSKNGLKRFLEHEKLAKTKGLAVSGLSTGASQGEGTPFDLIDLNFPYEGKYGTVGSVALDKMGNLAAATSTGGITGKDTSRIGDSPIIGAGTYANNDSCAVSCTGHGEHFIRAVAAHEVHALMKYAKENVQDAARKVIFEEVAKTGGDGGLIVIDTKGGYAMPYNTHGMFRGVATNSGEYLVSVF